MDQQAESETHLRTLQPRDNGDLPADMVGSDQPLVVDHQRSATHGGGIDAGQAHPPALSDHVQSKSLYPNTAESYLLPSIKTVKRLKQSMPAPPHSNFLAAQKPLINLQTKTEQSDAGPASSTKSRPYGSHHPTVPTISIKKLKRGKGRRQPATSPTHEEPQHHLKKSCHICHPDLVAESTDLLPVQKDKTSH